MNKANRSLGLIKYSKKYLPSDVLNKMYRGIVEPQLSYCCSVWGCCSESKINALQKIQNRAARIVTNSSCDASNAPLIQNLGWPTISNLIRKETATLTYKSLNSLAPVYMKNLFTKYSDDRERSLLSTETDLRLPLLKTANGQNSPVHKLLEISRKVAQNFLKGCSKSCHFFKKLPKSCSFSVIF